MSLAEYADNFMGSWGGAMDYRAPVLVDLDRRAVADEKDREGWLAARRAGITATEVRDLFLRKVSAAQLAKQKRAGDEAAAAGSAESEKDLARVPVIAWGRAREGMIVDQLSRGFGLKPETRVFHAAADVRHLASPDALGVDFDERIEIAEVKTGHPDFFGHAGMVKKGYLAQMVWQMYVVGAWRCRFVFEAREGDRDAGFTPGETYREDIVLADHLPLLEELLGLANGALAVIAGAEPIEDINEDIDVAAVNYLAALESEKALGAAAKEAQAAARAATAAKVEAYEEVRRLAGSGEFGQETPLARVTKSADVVEEVETRVVPDRPAILRARQTVRNAQLRLQALEEKYATVTRESVTKPGRLTITSPQKRRVQGE